MRSRSCSMSEASHADKERFLRGHEGIHVFRLGWDAFLTLKAGMLDDKLRNHC
jgi:hypothetical protein